MDLYHLALFAHIIGAIPVVGMGFVSPLILGGLRRSETVAQFREWGGVLQKMSKVTGMAAAVVFVSGLYMGLTQHSFAQGWLAVSLVLFIVNGVLAGGMLDKHLAKIMEATGDAESGPVPAEASGLATAPKIHTIEAVALGNDLAIVFLMTNKPGWSGALLVAAAGLAIAAGIVARHARSRRTAPAVAA
jgi:uncharacterized membrane protein